MRRVCPTQSRGVAETAKKARLGDVCHIEAGNSAPQNKSLYQKGEYPFVRTSDVGAIHFGVLESTRDLLNKNGIHGLRLFKSGGILFPKSGASTFLNHRVLLGMDAYVSSHLAIITPNSDFVDGHYLLHGLSTIDTREIFPNTDYPSLRTSDIADITLRLPGLGFQKRIAAVLDKICELKKNAETRLEKLDTLVKSRFAEMFGDVITNSKHFQCEFGKNLFSFSSGKFLDTAHRMPVGVPVYGGNGIAWYTDRALINFPTIVLGRVGAYCGNVKIVNCPAWITDNAIFIKEFKRDCFDITFLGLYMSFIDFSRFAAKSGQPKITQRPLENTKYILPPLALQREFAAFVEKIDKLRETARQTVKAMDTLYRAKLQEFFG